MGFEFDYWVTTDASDVDRYLLIWQGNDVPAGRMQHRASYEARSTTW